MKVDVLAADAVPAADLDAFLRAAWGSEAVVAHGDRIFPSRLSGFAAVANGRIVGHASYRVVEGACEVASIAAEPPGMGTGSRLLDRVIAEARSAGCRGVWLTTTNDNLDALGFYQRRGFKLVALRPGAVDLARRDLKPEIPELGSRGIPIRDELDLELTL